MPPSPPPHIPANELRPGRNWYAIAAAIAVISIVLGAALGVHRFNSAVDAVDTDHRFSNGDTITLRLEPDRENAIWLKDPGPWFESECDITGPGDPVLADPGIDVFLSDTATWNPLYTIDVPQAGDYEITCSAPEPGRYAIGDSGGFLTLVGWLVLAVVLALLGIGTCAVIVLVTAVRRHLHRKRLRAERHGSGGAEPAHPYPEPAPGRR